MFRHNVVSAVLSNVLPGAPVVFDPWSDLARYAAEYRSDHWSEARDTTHSKEINRPKSPTPYPKKAYQVAHDAEHDQGNNFGRLARTGMMNDYLLTVL